MKRQYDNSQVKREDRNYGNGNRGSGNNADFRNKRQRSDGYGEALAVGKFELRLLIPSKAAGAVIGKGGDHIKAVRDKFNASLDVRDQGTPDRVLSITTDLDLVKECFKEVLYKLAEVDASARKMYDDELEIRMLVHQSHAGAIIGKGGEKIKQLRQQTKSNMKLYSANCPLSTDRVVQIFTDQENMPEVVQTLIDFLRETPTRGPVRPYDAANYDPNLVQEYGGYMAERGGRYGGPTSQRGGPPAFVPTSGYGGYDNYGGPPEMQPYGAEPYLGGAVISSQVTIPDSSAGAIIGKGGERINKTRRESGAKIEIGEIYRDSERIITITGTPGQIQHAQYLLQEAIIRHQQN